MSQAVDCDLYLYANDSCPVYMGKYIKDIEDNLNRNFNCLCDWFVENKIFISERTKRNQFLLEPNGD